MGKKVLIAAALTFIFLILIILFSYDNTREVCFESRCIDVKIADSSEERARGLMFVRELDEDEGMLFVFPEEDKYGFWMKNTFIPLDIIWIDSYGKVVYITENVQPCKTETCESYIPDENALYVLELNSGRANEMGLNIGDNLDIKI